MPADDPDRVQRGGEFPGRQAKTREQIAAQGRQVEALARYAYLAKLRFP